MIVKTGNKYTVMSESGKRMGSYGSKAKAEKRLAQVEYWKARQEKASAGRRA